MAELEPDDVVPIPTEMLPADGRFGSGPSRVRPSQAEMVAALSTTVMGTSHRQAPVRGLVRRVREGLSELFDLPEGYEVMLGNGGTTAFWDAAAFCLVRERAQHAAFGEFGSKFAAVTDRAPFLGPSDIRRADAGSLALCTTEDGEQPEASAPAPDVYAYPHNETSTGVVSPVRRLGPASALTLVDATSIAGAAQVDVGRPTSTTSHPRRPSPATAGSGWPCAPPLP